MKFLTLISLFFLNACRNNDFEKTYKFEEVPSGWFVICYNIEDGIEQASNSNEHVFDFKDRRVLKIKNAPIFGVGTNQVWGGGTKLSSETLQIRRFCEVSLEEGGTLKYTELFFGNRPPSSEDRPSVKELLLSAF
jgi:hypothetical protein